MQTDKRIQILLSTYNGERYLSEQLDSFVSLQQFEQVKVLVRDDGSTDQTVDILREYQARYGFEIICGENIGVNRSILALCEQADTGCDYFALSDQDDEWLPDKLVKACAMLDRMAQADAPTLFASLSVIADQALIPIGLTLDPKRPPDFLNAMVQNVCPGHTQVFNRAMMIELRKNPPEKAAVIDHWLYMVASGLGKVCFLSQPTVLHRQHGNNAVGYSTGSTLFFNRVRRYLTGLRREDPMAQQLAEFVYLYHSRLAPENQQEAIGFFICQKSLFKRIHFALHTKVYRQTEIETWVFKILFVLGKYQVNGFNLKN